jgi:hypothetical protein
MDRRHKGVDTSALAHRIADPLMLNESILENPEVLQESENRSLYSLNILLAPRHLHLT